MSTKTWVQNNKGKVVFAIIFSLILRFALFLIPTLTTTLQYRFELSTPLSSFPRLQNCLFTAQHIAQNDPNISDHFTSGRPLTPYASDTCTIPVIIILLGQAIQSVLTSGPVGPILGQTFGQNNLTPTTAALPSIFFGLICIADIITAICLANLVYYYQRYRVLVPTGVDGFRALQASTTATTFELSQLLSTRKSSKTKFNDGSEECGNGDVQGEFGYKLFDFETISSGLFYAYLFNPITLISSLALNSTHLTIALQVLILTIVGMGKRLGWSDIVLAGFLNGILITADPSYLALIPGVIVMVLYRKKADWFERCAAKGSGGVGSSSASLPASSSPKPSSPLLPQPNSPLSNRFMVFFLYTIPIMIVYITIVCVEHAWANDLHEVLHGTFATTTNLITSLLNNPSSTISSFDQIPLPHLVHQLKQFFSPWFLHSYTIHFNFVKSRPTIGAMWYFFVQMFSRFRLFYALIIPAPLLIHSLAFATRLYRYPLFVLSATTTALTIFHPNPTLQHHILHLALIYINTPILSPRLGRMVFILFAMAHFLVGSVTMWYSWIDLGSGNPNFVFFQSILFNGFSMFLLLELVSAVRSLQSIPYWFEPGVYNSARVSAEQMEWELWEGVKKQEEWQQQQQQQNGQSGQSGQNIANQAPKA